MDVHNLALLKTSRGRCLVFGCMPKKMPLPLSLCVKRSVEFVPHCCSFHWWLASFC